MKGVIATVAWLLVLASPLHAQNAASVLQGKEITESALVEALMPTHADCPPNVRCRSIKIGGPASGTGAVAEKPRSKDVLITFETNSAELSEEGKASLDIVARAFNNEKLAALTFAIEGHADPRGTPDENLRLSQARAESVRNYLVAMKGVSADRLRAIGKGDREPLNSRVIAAPENRRVTFVTNQ